MYKRGLRHICRFYNNHISCHFYSSTLYGWASSETMEKTHESDIHHGQTWVAASGKNLTTIYITHGHGDHWFGIGPLERFPNARAVATPDVVRVMRQHASPEFLARPAIHTEKTRGGDKR